MESWGCEFLELETPSDFAIESKKVYYLPISLVDLMVDEIEISNILRKDRDYIEQLKYEIRKYGLLQPGLVLLATNGVILKEVARGQTVENIRTLTDVDFIVADNLGIMEDNFSKYDPSSEEDIFA